MLAVYVSEYCSSSQMWSCHKLMLPHWVAVFESVFGVEQDGTLLGEMERSADYGTNIKDMMVAFSHLGIVFSDFVEACRASTSLTRAETLIGMCKLAQLIRVECGTENGLRRSLPEPEARLKKAGQSSNKKQWQEHQRS